MRYFSYQFKDNGKKKSYLSIASSFALICYEYSEGGGFCLKNDSQKSQFCIDFWSGNEGLYFGTVFGWGCGMLGLNGELIFEEINKWKFTILN